MARDTSHESRVKKDSLAAFITAGVAAILVLIPFHAFLTVWAASMFGHYTLLRLWKELLLVLLVLASGWLVWRQRSLWHELRRSWLFRLMLAYVLLQILLGLAAYTRHEVNRTALGEGLIEDVRLMLIFFVAWVAASCSPWLRGHWQKLVLVPAAIVVVFGLLQAFVLPANFLGHFGYGPATIRPYELVDLNPNFVRVQSTLRGANPLGAYLVLIITAVISIYLGARSRKHEARPADQGPKKTVIPAKAGIQSNRNYFLSGPSVKSRMTISIGVASLVVLYFTYSRTGYIGAMLAVAAIIWLSVTNAELRRWLLVAAVAVFVVFGGLVLVLRHNATFEDAVFHTSQQSRSPQSSNQNRTSALQGGLHDVAHEPLGRGPGTAGPASVHNNHPARIAENYYLQIGQETGWLGLALFLAINFLVAKELWMRRIDSDGLPIVLLASLAGITVINLLSHAWADDTLAYLFWGLAGVALAPIAKQKNKE